MSEPMERLQVLVTAEQRRRLTLISQDRGEPVTALVRKAIDETFPSEVDPVRRRDAARRLLDRQVPHREPHELDEALADRFDPIR